MAEPQIGHTAEVVPLHGGREAEREEVEQAIQLWCLERDLSDALSREEIGAMNFVQRMDAQRKALIIGFAQYLRKHERSDVALGVYLVQVLLSDNERGCASISQPTLAKLFKRSVSSIADAQRRLKEDNLIVMTRGRYAGAMPIIPRAVTRQYNHMTWVISAICAQDGAVNLPAPPDDCQSTGQTRGLKQIQDQSLGGTGGLKSVNHPVEGSSIIRPDPIQLLSKTSKEERGPIAKVATALAATFAAAMPLAAAAHPVEQVIDAPAECWQTQKAKMAAGLDPHIAKLQRQIWLTPTGRVEVAGDFRSELEREYPLVGLKNGLAAACQNVKPDTGVMNCIQAVHRQFGFMQQDAESKQKVAEAYRKADAPPGRGLLGGDIPLTKPRPRLEAE